MRGDSRRQEQDTVQCQRVTRGKCRLDVPDVDGIERAAENSEACAEAHSAKFIFRGAPPHTRLGRLRGRVAPLRSLAGALCAPPLCGSANEILVAGRITV